MLGHRHRVINREHLLRAMTPIYLAWVASYALEVQTYSPLAVEDRLESLCAAFEDLKPYLLSRWRWPDRFNP
jgi:glucosylglycerate synthase